MLPITYHTTYFFVSSNLYHIKFCINNGKKNNHRIMLFNYTYILYLILISFSSTARSAAAISAFTAATCMPLVPAHHLAQR